MCFSLYQEIVLPQQKKHVRLCGSTEQKKDRIWTEKLHIDVFQGTHKGWTEKRIGKFCRSKLGKTRRIWNILQEDVWKKAGHTQRFKTLPRCTAKYDIPPPISLKEYLKKFLHCASL